MIPIVAIADRLCARLTPPSRASRALGSFLTSSTTLWYLLSREKASRWRSKARAKVVLRTRFCRFRSKTKWKRSSWRARFLTTTRPHSRFRIRRKAQVDPSKKRILQRKRVLPPVPSPVRWACFAYGYVGRSSSRERAHAAPRSFDEGFVSIERRGTRGPLLWVLRRGRGNGASRKTNGSQIAARAAGDGHVHPRGRRACPIRLARRGALGRRQGVW